MSTTNGLTMTELREKYEALQGRFASTRSRADRAAKKLQNTAVRTGAAYAVTKWQRSTRASGGTPFSLMGLTPLQTVAALAIVGGEFIDGEAGEVVTAIGEGALCAAASEMANT